MKFFTKSGTIQKIVIALVIVILVNFAIPHGVYANPFKDIGQTLLKELINFVCALGDVAMGILNNTMLGAKIGSAMLPQTDININNEESWLQASSGDKEGIITDEEVEEAKANGKYVRIENMDGGLFGYEKYQIPNMLFSPESIFSNNIAALDVNFLSPNTYKAVTTGEEVESEDGETIRENRQNGTDDKAVTKAHSSAGRLQSTIANWYKTFRNIAIVGLLSVLIYLGIRILLSSTAADKAKYKQSLGDWFIGLCLVFVIHFLMSGILMLTDKATELFTMNSDTAIIVDAYQTEDTSETSPQHFRFKTNLLGLARFKTQTDDWYEVTAYGLIYLVLVMYTWLFTFMYLKRLLYMAFFTMIAPLVALTYPLDKRGDSKAQAFDMWFKEYTMNAIIQPVHLILYTMFVGSAIDLATDNMLYAIVAVGFLIPAEQFIKKMFGLDKGESVKGAGSFAAGALTMTGLNRLSSLAKGGAKNATKKLPGMGKDGKPAGTNGGFNPTVNKPKGGLAGAFGGAAGKKDDSGSQNPPIGGAGGNNNGQIDQEEQEQRDMLSAYGLSDEEIDKGFGSNDGGGQELDTQGSAMQYLIDNSDDDEEENANTNSNVNTTETATVGANGQSNASSGNITQKPREYKGLQRAGRRLKLAAPKIGRGAYKAARVGSRIAGGMAGGMVGIAAGVASGDLSKAVQYGTAGAVAGGTGAGALVDKAGNIPQGIKDLNDFRATQMEELKYNNDVARYGQEIAAERAQDRQNVRMKKEFMNNKEEQRKFAEMAVRIKRKTGESVDVKTLQEADWNYRVAGISDEKLREKAMTEEAKNGGVLGENHERMIAIADYSTKFDQEYITNKEKNAELKAQLQKELPNNKDAQKQIENLLASLYGVKRSF